MRRHRVPVELWSDERFTRLDRLTQWLYLYLLTGPLRPALPGVVLATPKTIAAPILDLTEAEVQAALKDLRSAGLVQQDPSRQLLVLPLAIADAAPENPNVVTSWRSTKVPDCPLGIEAVHAIAKRLQSGFSPKFLEAFAKAFPKAFGEVFNLHPDNDITAEYRRSIGTVSTRGTKIKTPTAEQLRDAWHEHAPKLRRCLKLSGPRRAKARRLLKEHTLEEMAVSITRMNASRFLTGGGRRGWIADFDFLLKEGTYTHVAEGRYDDNEKQDQGQQGTRGQQAARSVRNRNISHVAAEQPFVPGRRGVRAGDA